MVSLFKKIAGAVVKKVAPVMDPLTVAFVHPVKTVKAIFGPTTLKQVEEEHFAQPLKKQITQIVLATVGYEAAIVGGAAVGGAAKAGTLAPKAAAVAKSLIPTTLKGKAIAAVAAPVVIGAVINQPAKVAEAVAKTPSALANVGGNIANLVADPSIANAKALVTENPVIVGGAAAVAAIAGAKTILPAVVTSRQIAATEKQTEAIEAATAGISGGGISVIDKSGEMNKPYSIETAPTTAKTEIVKEGVTKLSTKRKKRSIKAAMPSVNQKVNVIVSNRSVSTGIRQTHKYLNREILA